MYIISINFSLLYICSLNFSVCVYIYIYIYVYICVCVYKIERYTFAAILNRAFCIVCCSGKVAIVWKLQL